MLKCVFSSKKYEGGYEVEYWRSLFDNVLNKAPVGIIILDDETNIVKVNDAVFKCFGVPFHDFVGKRFGNLFHCSNLEQKAILCGTAEHCKNCDLRAAIKKVQDQGKSFDNIHLSYSCSFDDRQVIKDFIVSATPFQDATHRYTLVMFSDRTQERDMLHNLNETNIKYNMLFQNITQGFALHEIVLDEKGKPIDYRFLDINPAFEHLTELRKEDLIGNLCTVVLPNTEDYWVQTYGKVALTGQPIQFQNYSNSIGKYYEVWAFSPQKGQFATVFNDITEQKLAAIALEKSQKQHKSMVENISDVICILDQNFQFKYVTQNIEKHFGYTVEECLNSGLTTFLHPKESFDVLQSFYHILNRNQSITNSIIQFKRTDGSFAYVSLSVKNLLNDPDIEGLLINFHDVSQEEQSRQELQKMDNLLSTIAECTRLFFEMTSHLALRTSLPSLVATLEATRARFFSNILTDQNQVISSKPDIYWCFDEENYGIGPSRMDTLASEIYFDHFLELKENKCQLYHVAKLLPSQAKQLLLDQGVASVLFLPLLVNKSRFGFLQIDFCEKEHMVTEAEISILQVFMDSIAKGIEKNIVDDTFRHYYYHDPLTGLYNRDYIFENLNSWDTSENYPLSIIFADINGLGAYNEAFGYTVGDEMIKLLASVINDTASSKDIVARWSGDEFIIILPNKTSQKAHDLVQSINQNLRLRKFNNSSVSLSYGIATKLTKGLSLHHVIRQAEENLIKAKNMQIFQNQGDPINMILQTLHEKNKREELHSRRVSNLCVAIGSAMNLSEPEIDKLRMIGLVHDIGKIGIHEQVLNKRGKLTAQEWAQIRQHPEIGYRILSANEQTSELAFYVLSHHERLDGSGFPNGIGGDSISHLTRILSIADAYDAMTSSRSYRESMTEAAAIEELRKNKGSQFDENIVETFVKVLQTKDLDF